MASLPASARPCDALEAAQRLDRWLRSTDLLGYDPYDALRSPLLAWCCRGAWSRRAAIQALRRLPINVRPVLGIRPYASAKGSALVAAAAAKLFAATGDAEWAGLADESAARAVGLAVEADGGLAWGYPFDVQLRWGAYAADTPNVIATVFVADCLLVVADLLGRHEHAATALRTTPFLDRLVTGSGERFYAYVPGNATAIHNANVLAASLRGRLAAREGASLPADVGAALEFTLRRQREDGAWPYGERKGLEWVDGFHTAYVLSALAELHALTGRSDVERALVAGTAYYVENLFERDGTPRYYAGSTYPLDAHNAATAISALRRLAKYDARADELSDRVLRWTLSRLRTRQGWFLYQRGRLHVKRVPYLRWSNGHMLGALADVVWRAGDVSADRRRAGARGGRG